jgi:hypothetical protein
MGSDNSHILADTAATAIAAAVAIAVAVSASTSASATAGHPSFIRRHPSVLQDLLARLD